VFQSRSFSKDSHSPTRSWLATPAELHEAIRRRPEEVYLRHGSAPRRDLENWSQAEREILGEFARPRRAILVKVDGIQYAREYAPATADGYAPSEFAAGDRFPVRFEGDKMFVKRPNGRELQTTIVQMG